MQHFQPEQYINSVKCGVVRITHAHPFAQFAGEERMIYTAMTKEGHEVIVPDWDVLAVVDEPAIDSVTSKILGLIRKFEETVSTKIGRY